MKPMNFPGRKSVRRQKAQKRKEAYDKLSAYDKLAKLEAGEFRAVKQRERLEREIAKLR